VEGDKWPGTKNYSVVVVSDEIINKLANLLSALVIIATTCSDINSTTYTTIHSGPKKIATTRGQRETIAEDRQ
jgi:hypothetical protein